MMDITLITWIGGICTGIVFGIVLGHGITYIADRLFEGDE